MKTTQAIFITLGSAIALTIVGIMSYDTIAALLLPKMDHMQFTVTVIGTQFSNAIWFGMVCGLLPIALYSIWLATHTKENRKKLLSTILILVCMLTALITRYFVIKSAAQKINISQENITMNTYDMNNLHYALYLFFGLLAGTLISFIILKRK